MMTSYQQKETGGMLQKVLVEEEEGRRKSTNGAKRNRQAKESEPKPGEDEGVRWQPTVNPSRRSGAPDLKQRVTPSEGRRTCHVKRKDNGGTSSRQNPNPRRRQQQRRSGFRRATSEVPRAVRAWCMVKLHGAGVASCSRACGAAVKLSSDDKKMISL